MGTEGRTLATSIVPRWSRRPTRRSAALECPLCVSSPTLRDRTSLRAPARSTTSWPRSWVTARWRCGTGTGCVTSCRSCSSCSRTTSRRRRRPREDDSGADVGGAPRRNRRPTRGVDETAPAPNRYVLSTLVAVVDRKRQREGLPSDLIRAMGDIAVSQGFPALVAPIRPTSKDRYPLIPIERYVAWRRDDGLPFDPGSACTPALARELLEVCPESMRRGQRRRVGGMDGPRHPRGRRLRRPRRARPDPGRGGRGLYVEPRLDASYRGRNRRAPQPNRRIALNGPRERVSAAGRSRPRAPGHSSGSAIPS